MLANTDPLGAKHAARRPQPIKGTPTFGQMASAYHESHEGWWRSSKHARQWMKTIASHCAPIIDMPVNQIATKDVLAVLKPLWARAVQRGVRDASRGTSYVGPALDWSRLSYASRVNEMRNATLEGLQGNTALDAAGNRAIREIKKRKVLFVANAVPDSLSVAAAREMVGQPHLTDHGLRDALTKLHGGPIHLLACHKGVTESQARIMLGFPDATVVSAPFGVYDVDPVQSIQLVLLAQCRDATSTRLGVQRFLEWLDESEQSVALIQHAAKRKLVVKALAGK